MDNNKEIEVSLYQNSSSIDEMNKLIHFTKSVNNNLIIAGKNNSIQLSTQNLIPFRRKNLWGYCSPNKTIIIQPRFIYCSYFEGDLAYVEDSNGKKYFIDNFGDIKLKCNKSHEYRIDKNNNIIAHNKRNGLSGIYDKNGFINRLDKYDVSIFQAAYLT